MSKSLAQKKSDKKKRGERKTKTRIRDNGYTRSSAPHCLPGPADRATASMLVRNAPTEMRRVDVDDWHREGDTEIVAATAHFACGCARRKEARIEYKPGERQKLFEAMVGDAVDTKLVTRLDNLRRGRWQLKQEVLRELHREYGKGLPPHDHAEAAA